jgi:phospholipase C
MSDDDQRNALIVENNKRYTDWTIPQLQAMTNQELVQMGLEWFAKPTMKGYVRDYTNLLRHHGYKEDDVKRYAEQVMQSYMPDQLPDLNGLAEHYAVCDMWFSSVPSQTNPNRAFAFCGTSMGLVDNGFLEEDPRRVAIENYVGYKLGDDRFKAKTILNALADDGKTTWKVFRQSGLLQNNVSKAVDILNKLDPAGWLYASSESKAYLKELSSSELVSDYTHRLFPEILKIKDADSHFTKLDKLDDFHSAARAGQLPNFTYIQPEWTIGERGTGGALKSVLFHQGDDYHPPGNLDAGENLVKQIYNSLISNRKAWEKTLLVITFDEPIGSFDHYPPPATIPPWVKGKAPELKRQYNFNFDRYGGRVPTILVSPLVEKSTVFRSTTSVPFDHTSIIATILKWRGLENKDFGERTRQAPTFENVVSLNTPRNDEKEVRFLKLFHKAGEPVRFHDRFHLRDAMGKYISGFREHAVFPRLFFFRGSHF